MASHLTLEERDRIAQRKCQGVGQNMIAEALNRSPSTISRELRRNRTGGHYFAAQAQERAQRIHQTRGFDGSYKGAERCSSMTPQKRFR